MKPLIGITATYKRDDFAYWQRGAYAEKIIKCGGLPLLLPHLEKRVDIEELCQCLDGVILAGGGDIDPVFWGEESQGLSKNVDVRRDAFELNLARLAWQRRLPVLGICRGMQVMNVALGGTLYEDLPSEMFVRHEQQMPFQCASHCVRVQGDNFLSYVDSEELAVNSFHHQGVKKLAPVLQVAAVSDDSLVEAFTTQESGRFFVGVQWHPEWLEKEGEQIFEILLNSTQSPPKYI